MQCKIQLHCFMECNKTVQVIISLQFTLPSQIPHPPPPPAYEPVEAVWVNYTVEKEDGAASEMSSGPLPPSTESFVIENATLGATYTITVSALNQLGWGQSINSSYRCISNNETLVDETPASVTVIETLSANTVATRLYPSSMPSED